MVGLNSDRSVRELKGPGRPIIDQQGRAEMLAALACVDYVVIFDEASVAGLVERVRPDVLVKAAQYSRRASGRPPDRGPLRRPRGHRADEGRTTRPPR